MSISSYDIFLLTMRKIPLQMDYILITTHLFTINIMNYDLYVWLPTIGDLGGKKQIEGVSSIHPMI